LSLAFSRTLRSLEADRSRLGVAAAFLAVLVLGGWTVWMVRASVPVFAASREARLVTDRAVYALEAPVSGRVESVAGVLEQHVRAGEILVQLDDQAVRISREEQLALAEVLERRIAGTREILAAGERSDEEARDVDRATLAEAALARKRRVLEKQLAEEELRRLEILRESSVSELDISKARTQVAKGAVAIQEQDATIGRLGFEHRRAETDRTAQMETLRRELAQEEGELASAHAAAERFDHEIERLRVRAPADGVVGDLASVARGSYVEAGAHLGTVIAPGRVAVQASFAPADAVGRVREGQPAELVLDGFPRLEFGTLPLAVARVASETRNGLVQVELSLAEPHVAGVPVEHGLPGRVRVEVERATPAELLLRAIGRKLGSGAGQDVDQEARTPGG
jgi:membrane fusion protein (multidrug efflux system)